jgi:hypothetical protein
MSFSQPAVTCTLLGTNIFLNDLFLNDLNVFSSLTSFTAT